MVKAVSFIHLYFITIKKHFKYYKTRMDTQKTTLSLPGGARVPQAKFFKRKLCDPTLWQ